MCAPALQVAELLTEQNTFRGALVGLKNARVAVLLTCTEQACGADNPCCNDCSARATVAEAQRYLNLKRPDGTAYGASGTGCKLHEAVGLASGLYSIVGTLEVDASGPALRVRSIVAE